jgi:hypothetical protein
MNGASRSLLSKIVEHEIQERAWNEALTNNAEEIRQNKVLAFEEAKKYRLVLCLMVMDVILMKLSFEKFEK